MTSTHIEQVMEVRICAALLQPPQMETMVGASETVPSAPTTVPNCLTKPGLAKATLYHSISQELRGKLKSTYP